MSPYLWLWIVWLPLSAVVAVVVATLFRGTDQGEGPR